MRTQDSPASSVLGGPLGHNVFLPVVVDRRNETWLRLLRGSIEGPKMEAVRFSPAGKDDALKGLLCCFIFILLCRERTGPRPLGSAAPHPAAISWSRYFRLSKI